MAEPQREDQRCLFVALIGAPNAGKSTLVNALVGTKVAIVTHKAQTTRATLRGIAMHGDAQIVLIDTPGIFAPKRGLDKAMVDAAWGGAGDADMTALLVDARKGVCEETEAILNRLSGRQGKVILVLNKIDLVTPEELLPLAEKLNEQVSFDETFMVSAKSGSGVEALRDYLAKSAPVGPWHYPADEVSDAPLRALASEITREKLFLRVHDEVPYQSTVETTLWKQLGPKRVRIEQTIFVSRDSQKAILLGHKGATVKAISMAAREELAEILEMRVDLFLFVKVRANWSEDPERFREMGLEKPQD